ncbi:MAG: hypothetical protein V7756_03210 [Halopseudomonas sp.]|uniref:hypothetical protein n=1 Tax=Halopseudomonas sp. TaxID=2901191 RepID=UPI0030036A0C
MKQGRAWLTWLSLLLLLGLSLALAHWMTGTTQHFVSIGCALVMVAVIAGVQMRLRRADHMHRLFALGGLVWLALLAILTALEIATRHSL